MEIMSIASSVVSIILGLFAIALSVYFYTQSKNTEARVTTALEGIRTQSDSLQKLTGRWMDRLTKYVTTPREDYNDTNLQLLIAIKELPTNIISHLAGPSQSASTAREKELLKEIVICYGALYYYTAVANVWAQFNLPPLERFDETPDYSNLVKKVVDQSCADFKHIAAILGRTDQSLIQSAPIKHLLDEALNMYRDLVADTTQVYAKRAEQCHS